MGSEASRALVGGALTLLVALAVLTRQTMRIPSQDPDRLVAELRLAQAAAVLLAFSAAFIAGLAASSPGPVVALDMAAAVLCCGLALMTLVRDPRAALAWLAGAFVVRALTDVAHLPSWLPTTTAPVVHAGSAAANLVAAALVALPLLRSTTR
ncbi:MAG TPA: hypothetical protein VMF13_08400 [Luteitalea sp.]|nr:hypothetical protein [Luteitalea sp.]